ncbi:MAG: DUF692 family protein [Desulfobacteraceae bacterium]|nr:MAG: DUF692 family protein [Desulfobacteraceae bacterium]
MLKLAAPISHLFKEGKYAEQIIMLSDCLECREWCIQTQLPKQELIHFDVNIIHNWNNEIKQYINNSILSKPELELVTFHMAACCDMPLVRNGMYQPGGRQYSRKELLENAAMNIKWLRSFLPQGIEIGVENTNYFPTPAYCYITESDFITDVVTKNNIHLLLDIAHGKITAYNKKIDYRDYLATLPINNMIQLHISGHGIDSNNIAYDAHDLPDESIYREVQSMIEMFPVKYLTVEFYKDHDGIIRELERYNRLKDYFNAS